MNHLGQSMAPSASEAIGSTVRPVVRAQAIQVAPWILPLLAVGPILVRFFLPVSAELALSFSFFGVRLFIGEAFTLLVALVVAIRNRPDLPLLLISTLVLFGGLLSATFVAREPTVALAATYDVFIPLLLLTSIRWSEQHRRPLAFLLGTAVVGLSVEVLVVNSGLLVVDGVNPFHVYAGWIRSVSTIGSPTATGAMLLLLTSWFYSVSRGGLRSTLILSMGGIGILGTLSRGPIAMAICLFAWFLVARSPARRRRTRLFARLAPLALVALVLPALPVTDALGERTQRSQIDSGRFERYAEAWDAFKSAPMTGVGLGEYQPRNREGLSTRAPLGTTSPHNMYLLYLAECGVPGLVLLLVLVGLIGWRSLPRLRAEPMTLLLPILATIGFATELLYAEAQFATCTALVTSWLLRPPQERHDPRIVRLQA